MALENIMKKMNKGLVTSALCSALLLIPVKGAQAQEIPSSAGNFSGINTCDYRIKPYDLGEILFESELLISRYGPETAGAILEGLSYNRESFVKIAAVAETLLEDYLITGNEEKDFGKFDKEVIFGMIKAYGSGASDLDSLIQNAYALESRFSKSELRPEEYSAGISALLEAIGNKTGAEASSIVDRYFSYSGPLDRNAMIRATSLSRSPEEVIEFGERLYFDTVDVFGPSDSMRIVKASYSFEPFDGPSRAPIATVKVYSREEVNAMMYAYGSGNMEQDEIVERMRDILAKYDSPLAEDLIIAAGFGKKMLSELEFTADALSGKYDNNVLGKILRTYGNTDNANLDRLYLCLAPVENKQLI